MNNSLVIHLQGYIQALFKDFAWMYLKPREWRRDQTRLLHELENRGPRTVGIDLPAVGKHFDKCLANGRLVPHSDMYLFRLGKSQKLPVFMGCLWSRVFDDDGLLRSSPCVDAVSALRQVYYSLKKLRLPCTKGRVRNELKEFFQIESQIRNHTFRWDCNNLFEDLPGGCLLPYGSRRPPSSWVSFTDILASEGESDLWGTSSKLFPEYYRDSEVRRILVTLQQVCDRVAAQLGDLHKEEPHELPKHGPGVVSHLHRGTSKYSFLQWTDKNEAIFPKDYYGYTDFGVSVDLERDRANESRNEYPSRLIAVPKTMKSPRLIAAEPNQHQWLQQLVRNQLEGRLTRTCMSNSVDFRSQERQRDRALSGSKSGLYCTIDLSSASDRLSCWVVERAFRSNLTILERLHAARTRWLSQEVDQYQPNFIRLKKFAPQGSAVTFPVQTIIYALVAITATIYANGDRVTNESIEEASLGVSVFGDDIIVPRDEAFELTVLLLQALGLKVNQDKTFGVGNFRESCGMDAFMGYDVTPAYMLNPAQLVHLKGYHSQLEVINNFFRRGWWNASDYLRSTLDGNDHLVPIVSSEDFYPGLLSFCGSDVRHLKRRWNKDLQRWEVRTISKLDATKTIQTPGSLRLFQWFIDKPLPDTKYVSGTRGRTVEITRPGWSPIDYMVNPEKLLVNRR